MDPDPKGIEGAAKTGTDRIELYTEAFAVSYASGNLMGVGPYAEAARVAISLGMGVNAGHDLSLDNLQYFVERVPGVLEVSIGHALISESLYYGLQNVVGMYLQKLGQ